MRALVYSALARVLGFIPQGIAGLVASHLIITNYGKDSFSSYALIVSVLLLIPLNNLGAGATVTQVIAAHGVDDDLSLRTGITAVRVLALSAFVVCVVSAGLGAGDLWPRLLGDASGGNAYVAVAIILYGLSFVPGLGQSAFLATGRNHLTIATQAFSTVLAAVFVWVLTTTDLEAGYLILIPSLGIFLVNWGTFALSQRVTGFRWSTALARAPFRARYPGARVRSLAIPMLITSLALPLAYFADRVVLSHVSSNDEVARYALVLQLFAPVTGLVVATAQPLWPMYTRARVDGKAGPAMRLVLAGFVGGTLVVSALMVVLADPIGNVISGDEISLGYGLPALAATVTTLQAVALPLSMSLVDPKGARLVAATSLLTVPANLVLSVVLAEEWGAAGPLVSGLLVGLFLQIVPWLTFSIRRSRSGEEIAVL
ncbi:O-antigen/teichoic acid export membrane protein [Marmoricola sp. OAE513]|uniref:lipopolysaccharide biosynthesis protein n=1 Tax=Marmoricola sp. OAE513 TaxID=2817894 RepID=UPI001AE1E96E